MPGLKITIPAQLPADPDEVYCLGWRNCLASLRSRGGRSRSPAKVAAARANGKAPKRKKAR